jgi:hypothetical protein
LLHICHFIKILISKSVKLVILNITLTKQIKNNVTIADKYTKNMTLKLIPIRMGYFQSIEQINRIIIHVIESMFTLSR